MKIILIGAEQSGIKLMGEALKEFNPIIMKTEEEFSIESLDKKLELYPDHKIIYCHRPLVDLVLATVAAEDNDYPVGLIKHTQEAIFTDQVKDLMFYEYSHKTHVIPYWNLIEGWELLESSVSGFLRTDVSLKFDIDPSEKNVAKNLETVFGGKLAECGWMLDMIELELEGDRDEGTSNG